MNPFLSDLFSTIGIVCQTILSQENQGLDPVTHLLAFRLAFVSNIET